jgi:stage II sporulation protein D
VQVAGRVTVVPLEDYVLGTALSELTPTSQSPAVVTRAYEVQAIIARTYASANLGRHRREGFDLCDKTHCQLYQPARVRTSTFAEAARDAVARTSGRILRFARRPAEALYHADCGGHTTTPASAWGGPAIPYLSGARDEVPGNPHRTWQFSATSGEWTALLSRDTRTNPGGPVRSIRVTARDQSGRATEVEIAGRDRVRINGETLRAVVTADRGARAVMSARFDVRATTEGFSLDGTGFGHGVGLCQVGTMARARRGDSVDAILGHYYPGAR